MYLIGNNQKVQKFSASGHPLWLRVLPADYSGSWSIAVAPDGTVYVPERSPHPGIRVLTTRGTLRAVFPGRYYQVAACQQSKRVRFYTAAGLTNELLEAQALHRLGRLEASLLRHDLLVLDEVGFVPFTKVGADLLFSCLSALHEQLSLIVTTTVPFAEWATLFGGDQRLTAALLDRLTFHAHVLQFSGNSFRLRHSLKHQEEDRRHH